MTIEYRRINHVTLAVPAGEHERVRTFYGGVLGLREVKRPEALGVVYDIIWYELLDMLLHIDFTPPWTKPAENRHVAVEVKDLHAVRAYLEEKGVEIREAVVIGCFMGWTSSRVIVTLMVHAVAIKKQLTWPRGCTALYFRDPDGHLIEFITPSVWSIYCASNRAADCCDSPFAAVCRACFIRALASLSRVGPPI